MNKRIIGIIAVIIIVVASIIYIAINDKTNKENVNKREEDSMQEKQDALENLPTEVDIEEAIRSGYVVLTYNKIYNKNVLEKFVKNTNIGNENRVTDSVRIIQFTIEGDPIITEIEYISEAPAHFVIRKDNTRDEFASKADRVIKENSDLPAEFYGALLEEDGENLKFEIATYAIVDRIDGKSYNTIDICRFSKNIEEASKYVKYENVSFLLKKVEHTEKYGDTELLVKYKNSNEFEKVKFIKTEEMKKENEVYAVDIPKFENEKYTVNGHIVENIHEEPGIRAYKFESKDGKIFEVVEAIMVQ